MSKLIICAEIGINHDGDMDLCHEMIRQAAISGADLVKFQLYEPKILFQNEPHLISEGERCQFTYNQFQQVLEWCNEENIEPFASVFDETRLEWTEKFNFKQYKIASRTVSKTPGFAKTIAGLGKPTYVSLGMCTTQRGIDLFSAYNNVKLLYCVSKYPASYTSYKHQPKSYTESAYCGISDHTLGIETSLVAIGRGAKFVEKHFTLSKTMKGSDHKCSITPDELHILSTYGRLMEKIQ